TERPTSPVRYVRMVISAAATVATTTASNCSHNPAASKRLESISRRASPLANVPNVRNSPASTTGTGVHHHRPNVTRAAGMSRIKKTGGTAGYVAPPSICNITPIAATSSAAAAVLPPRATLRSRTAVDILVLSTTTRETIEHG